MTLLLQSADIHTATKSALLGVAVGDALGVPVEFVSREQIRLTPVTDMTGYGTHNMPPGTFSDDGSMTLCLAEALTHGFDLQSIGQNFVRWRYENYWTARGKVFDIGITTQESIVRLKSGTQPEFAGGFEANSNGNGSLMRILPLLFYLNGKPANERFKVTRLVSSITHGHIRSVIACFYYLEFARQLLIQKDKFEIYGSLQTECPEILHALGIDPGETTLFDRLFKYNIHELPEEAIFSSGYVLHTLEASIWTLLTTNNYKDAVLKAVNLGDDSDTTGAVTGGLAGLLYGYDNIPAQWLSQLARKNDIEDLSKRLADRFAVPT